MKRAKVSIRIHTKENTVGIKTVKGIVSEKIPIGITKVLGYGGVEQDLWTLTHIDAGYNLLGRSRYFDRQKGAKEALFRLEIVSQKRNIDWTAEEEPGGQTWRLKDHTNAGAATLEVFDSLKAGQSRDEFIEALSAVLTTRPGKPSTEEK